MDAIGDFGTEGASLAALGVHSYVPEVVADDADAAYRATLGPSRYEEDGGMVRAVPRFTRAMAADLDFLELPAEQPAVEDFSPFLRPGTGEWDKFFSQRKVVKRDTEDGARLVSVTSNIADVLSSKKAPQVISVGARPKRFEVVHLLTDLTLVDKFSIKGGLRAEIRNLAVVDTVRAAKKLQDHVRKYEGYEKAEVLPGSYLRSWKGARESIKVHSARFPVVSVAVDATFIGDKVFMYGEAGVDGWRVFGPDKVASLVKLVHRMVSASSCESVAFALGPELTILDIDVHDGYDVISPVRERHAGNHDLLPAPTSPRVNSLLSTAERQRLEEMCRACETLAVDGEDCATAVRVTSRYVLLNTHVADEDGEKTSNGVSFYPRRAIGRDLWVAEAPGPEVAWHLREAVVGEKVVLCYRRHTELVLSGPVTVLTVSAETIAVEKDASMLPGVSGAAVVALSDLSLLGLYDGVAMRRGLVAAFTPAMYTDVCSASEPDVGCQVSVRAGGEGIYVSMSRRGLSRMVDGAMDALIPLYSGAKHVGMGFSHAGEVVTACDPDASPLALGPDTRPLVFDVLTPAYFSAAVAEPLPPPPPVVRKPAYGERVFVVGKDFEGEYCGTTFGKVEHVGVGAAHFRVAGMELEGTLPLVGGLVVAYADAAVVGVVYRARLGADMKSEVYCTAFPEVLPSAVVKEESDAEKLEKVFPFLNPAAWPEGLVSEALQHSSADGAYSQVKLAMIGDSAMRTFLFTALRDAGVPPRKWQTVLQTDQTNAVMSKVCDDLGLADLLKVGGGFAPVRGTKVYADLLEAVAGAVWLAEPADVFETFCLTARMVRDDYSEFVK